MEEAADIFLRAHALTGDARWLAEAMSDAQYALGANPLNMSYLIGLGGREPRVILNIDAEALGSGPPPGITVYGDYNIHDYGWNWFHTVMAGDVWPNYFTAPVSESFQAFEYFVPSAEYTVMQTMDSLMFVTGYLAAQGMQDAVRGGPNADVLRGTNASDIVLGESGADSIHGGAGNDRISGGNDDDLLNGGLGDDSIFGDQGADRLSGGDGNDVLAGGSGNDTITGGSGEDRLLGGEGADTLSGGLGNDTLLAGDGEDRVYGGIGNDVLSGGSGNDTIVGGNGADRLLGGYGRDTLSGGLGHDTLFGGNGGDLLYGGVGTDILVGGAGKDTLVGGLGADLFIFRQGSGRDVIRDFAAAEDRIRIDTAAGTDLAALLASGTLRADGLAFTLDLGDGDSLVIASQAPLTLAQLSSSIELL